MASTGAGGAGAGAGADHDNDNQKLIAALREETSFLREESSLLKQAIALLQQTQANHWNESTTFYASSHAQLVQGNEIPQNGMPARFVKELIDSVRLCDSRPQLNTGSYVNVVSEPEEREVASMGAEVNLANAAVYPGSINLHDTVVNLLAKLWNAPSEPAIRGGNYVGAGTVGSTEACLLAGGSCSVPSRLPHFFRPSNTIAPFLFSILRIGPQISLAKVVCCTPRPFGRPSSGHQAKYCHLDSTPCCMGKSAY